MSEADAGSRGLFITGTDTDVGKTWIAVALLRALTGAGLRAIGMKPVSAGVEAASGVNADVLALHAAGNVDAPAADRNPYAFAEPVAPHLAAETAGTAIDLSRIVEAARRLHANADALIVEGAGGALVPLDARSDMLDIAVALRLPVLLVVGMRLGCLNHALLSALAIGRRGLVLRGWVANFLPPRMDFAEGNLETLRARLGMPPIAIVQPDSPPAFDEAMLAALGFARRPTREPC